MKTIEQSIFTLQTDRQLNRNWKWDLLLSKWDKHHCKKSPNLVKRFHKSKLKFLWKLGFVESCCGELTLTGRQLPTKAALSLPSSAGQGREKMQQKAHGSR